MSKENDIISITPLGEDPLIYWHQVAQDAINAREKMELRLKMATNDLERIRAAAKVQSEEYGRYMAEKHHALPTADDLLRLVRAGEIDLNVDLRLTKHYE